jgi:hypothetical protein
MTKTAVRAVNLVSIIIALAVLFITHNTALLTLAGCGGALNIMALCRSYE